MPLIAVATLVFAAGLLVGFGGELVPVSPAAFAAAAAVAAVVLRRDRAGVGLAVIAISATLLADAARRSDARCLAQLARARSWTVRLDGAAAPGAYVRGRVAGGSCRLPVSLAVAAGAARDGSLVRVTGVPAEARRGLLLRRAEVRELAPPSGLPAVRASARVAIDEVFGSDAPVARALLVADGRLLAPEIRERFAAAGMVHLLAISGLHVGIIAAAAHLCFGAMRLSRRAAALATVATIVLYVGVLGFPAPACRAAVMLGVATAARLTQRPTSSWAVLAIGALLPLVQPRTILEIGYHLSVCGVATLMAAGALGRRVLAPRLGGWPLRVARDLLAGTLTTAATAPLVAGAFGVVSVVGPLTNLVAGPLLGLLQPMLFLALLLAPLPVLGRFVADAAHPLLRLLDAIASTGAGAPFATIAVTPSLGAGLLAGASAAAVLAACVARFPMRPLVAAAGSLALLAWLPLLPARPTDVELHVIDVGQGDAIAVRTDRGRWIVIDAGRAWRGGDAGRATILPYLRRRGGAMPAFVLSHPHADHAGGAATLIRALRPETFWDAGFVAPSETYLDALAAAESAGTVWRRARPGDSLRVDGVTLHVLAPDSAWTASLTDANEASVVVLVRFGSVRFLLVGDAERAEEQWLLDHAGDLRADVLKVGHHGSRTSSTQAFLDAVSPGVAVVSVGAGNSYGHPSPEVLAALADRGADVLRTDLMGTIVLRTDGTRLQVILDDVTWTRSDRW
ncbi:MAG TPA: DNA internalization-related competence protein ComEC/Rec2 [Gemmatimonadaceae bacterium]|nr:DNA internalization-related competence protein ComEC/Rec2 [Gemmatimonadaceae bacterium]